MQCEGLYSYWTLWTTQLIKCLEQNEVWTCDISIELPPVLQDETVNRRTTLIDESLKNLPRPMQNLLHALKQLKLKMEAHSLAYASNIESNYSSEAIIASKKICDVLSIAKTLRNSPLIRLDEAVEDKTQSYKSYLESIEIEASQLRKELFQLTESSRAFSHRTVLVDPIVKNSIKAVEDSEQFRSRLVTLAQGPLSTLFEYSDTTKETPNEDPVSVVDVPKANSEKIKEVQAKLDENQLKLKKLRYIADKIYSECASDAVKINQDAIESIKKIVLKVPKVEKYSVPVELKNADASLQKEIAMVLSTLTMDRGSLDIVLRSIKSECQALRIITVEELRSTMYKTLKEIQGLYTCASVNFIKTL